MHARQLLSFPRHGIVCQRPMLFFKQNRILDLIQQTVGAGEFGSEEKYVSLVRFFCLIMDGGFEPLRTL
ncbi:hypothetical protein YDYSG_21570 [Paenibacillus tyrfis]|nr:hypothetical protein YDYSG_21570 [Paenibacillus tyrfis]